MNAIIYPLVNKHNYGNSPCLMGKSTISMAIFNSYVSFPEGNPIELSVSMLLNPMASVIFPLISARSFAPMPQWTTACWWRLRLDCQIQWIGFQGKNYMGKSMVSG